MELRSFLTIDEIEEINQRIHTDEPFYDLYVAYSRKLNYEGKAVLYDYIKRNKYPVYITRIMGSKRGPYYESEEDMKLPEYKWEDVPTNERALLIKKSKDE